MQIVYKVLILVLFPLVTTAQNIEWKTIELIDTIPGYRFAVNKVASHKYPPSNLFDANLKTCWVSGDSPMFIRLDKTDKSLNIFGGYGKSEALFAMNDRPKEIKLSYFIGIHPEAHVSEIAAIYYLYPTDLVQSIEAKDSMYTIHQKVMAINDSLYQVVLDRFEKDENLPVSEIVPIVKLEVIDKYTGLKYPDMCISEIYLNDKFIHYVGNKKYNGKVKEFVVNKAENALIANYTNGQSRVLYQEQDEIVWLGESTEDKSWITVLTMPKESEGRGMTNYVLIHTLTGQILNSELEDIFDTITYQMFLIEENGKITLEYHDIDVEKHLIDLYY